MEGDEAREDMPGVSGEAVAQVLSFVLRNADPYNGVEGNFTTNIAQELGMTRRRTHRAVSMLEEYDLVERVRKGKKKIIVPKQWPDGEPKKGPIWN